MPSWPLPFSPPHHSVWSARMAQVCAVPAVTLARLTEAGLVTWCGAAEQMRAQSHRTTADAG
jgi:hypothetical protein